jgi:L-asparagine transporter-like permease
MNDNVFEMYKSVIDSERTIKEKKELLNEIRKLVPGNQNRWNFRWVIWALAAIAIVSPLTFIGTYFNLTDPKVPDAVIALSSTAVGALAAYITSKMGNEDGPP